MRCPRVEHVGGAPAEPGAGGAPGSVRPVSSSRARVLLLVTVLAVVLIAVVVTRQVAELRQVDGGPAAPVAVEDAPPPPAPPASSAPAPAPAPPAPPADDAAAPPPGVPRDAQRATVDRVVDGDTLRVAVGPDDPGPIAPTPSVPVRLLTIDTPETVHPQRDVECGGPEATARVRELVPAGSTVWLATDVSDTDRFDRHLRAVFTADGTFVNAVLVAEGLAEVVRFPPDERWFEDLRDLERRARSEGRGNWSRCAA